MTAVVEFYFSPGSRYSYLASTQLAHIARQTACSFRWLPLQSNLLIAAAHDHNNPFKGETGQYDWSYRKQDAAAWARHYGVAYLEPVGRLDFDSRLAALACMAGERQGAAESFSRLVMSLIFVAPGKSLLRKDLERAADVAGLDVELFCNDLASGSLGRDLEARIAEAAGRGAFGVPTFFPGERMFWGNDRLVLLQAALMEQP